MPGENYTQAILDALDAAPAIVLVFSSATNESPHVPRELEVAVGAGTRIVPVRLEAVEPTGSLRYFIGTSQWLDATGRRRLDAHALVRRYAAPWASRRPSRRGCPPPRRPRRRHARSHVGTATPAPTPGPAAAPPTQAAGRAHRRRSRRGRDLALVVTMSLTSGDGGGRQRGQRPSTSPSASVGRRRPRHGSAAFRPGARTVRRLAGPSPAGTTSSPRPTPRTARCRRALRAWPPSSPG